MITVMLVDDHPVVIEGLQKLLATAGDIEVVGSANDAYQALTGAEDLKPDVVLMDLRMPGATGIHASRQLRERDFTGAILLLTSYGDQAYITQALEAGADGYLLKNTPADKLIQAIRQASTGRRQISPELIDGVLSELGDLARERTARDMDMSEEDLLVLRRASEGATNRMIAMEMGRSEIAIKKRLKTIFDKLGVNDRSHAVAIAIRKGLI